MDQPLLDDVPQSERFSPTGRVIIALATKRFPEPVARVHWEGVIDGVQRWTQTLDFESLDSALRWGRQRAGSVIIQADGQRYESGSASTRQSKLPRWPGSSAS